MDKRRQEILDGALDVFLERGFDNATLAEIRTRSGASTGSIYHFFKGKADIAAALLTLATSGWSLQSPLAPGQNNAETAIKASVTGFLRWGRDNPRLFAFMDDLLARSGASPEFQPVSDMLAAGRARAGALYSAWDRKGVVRAIPWAIAYALIMGPAYAALRNSPRHALTDEDIAVLVDAAWCAVRAE